ncbi:hypothetical protein QTH60_14610, partial [Clostridium perfringens]|nr:hypothetical protein [Clostridium perfringens]
FFLTSYLENMNIKNIFNINKPILSNISIFILINTKGEERPIIKIPNINIPKNIILATIGI